jgi:hypothetical protein
MGRWNDEARHNSRWYASWLLAAAYVPIFILYCVWIPATFMGRIHGGGVVLLDCTEESEYGGENSGGISDGDVDVDVEMREYRECDAYDDGDDDHQGNADAILLMPGTEKEMQQK